MAFATKKEAIGWAKHHLSPTKYGNYYDPIDMTETQPVKVRDGIWKFDGRDDEWLDEIEAMNEGHNDKGNRTQDTP